MELNVAAGDGVVLAAARVAFRDVEGSDKCEIAYQIICCYCCCCKRYCQEHRVWHWSEQHLHMQCETDDFCVTVPLHLFFCIVGRDAIICRLRWWSFRWSYWWYWSSNSCITWFSLVREDNLNVIICIICIDVIAVADINVANCVDVRGNV